MDNAASDFDAEGYRRLLLEKLDALMQVVESETSVLCTYFDCEWADFARGEIRKVSAVDLDGGFTSDKMPLFFEFSGDFEGLCRLDARLSALLESGFEEATTRRLQDLAGRRFQMSQLETLFELSVLGFLADSGVLRGTEVAIGGGRTVDGVIELDKSEVAVEITLSRRHLIRSGACEGTVGLDAWEKIVLYKMKKKAGHDSQFGAAVTEEMPTILVFGKWRYEPEEKSVGWAVSRFFEGQFGPNLSAFVSSQSWHFRQTGLYVNSSATHQLTASAEQELRCLLRP